LVGKFVAVEGGDCLVSGLQSWSINNVAGCNLTDIAPPSHRHPLGKGNLIVGCISTNWLSNFHELLKVSSWVLDGNVGERHLDDVVDLDFLMRFEQLLNVIITCFPQFEIFLCLIIKQGS